ncbi:MAG: STAS domain-containing protein [Gemmatimonadaceae bacterium]
MADHLMVAAPTALTAQTRVEFRSAALDCLERVGEESGDALTIDMSATHDIDACGLGILVMVTKRARERGLATRLFRPSEDVRSLLQTTRLEPLFQVRSE